MFQELFALLVVKGQRLAGSSQEESFGTLYSPASPCNNRDSCSTKAAGSSPCLMPSSKALVLSLAPVVSKGGGVVGSHHSVYMLTGPAL